MPLPHRQEISRLAIAAPNVNARAVLQELSNDSGMAAPGGIGERRQARVGFLVIYFRHSESLAQIANHGTMPATSSGYERSESSRAHASSAAPGALNKIP
jgi:hypothetical protein